MFRVETRHNKSPSSQNQAIRRVVSLKKCFNLINTCLVRLCQKLIDEHFNAKLFVKTPQSFNQEIKTLFYRVFRTYTVSALYIEHLNKNFLQTFVCSQIGSISENSVTELSGINNFISFIVSVLLFIYYPRTAVRYEVAFLITNMIDSFQNLFKVGFVFHKTNKVFFLVSFNLHQKVVPITYSHYRLDLFWMIFLAQQLQILIISIWIGSFEVVLVHYRIRIYCMSHFFLINLSSSDLVIVVSYFMMFKHFLSFFRLIVK